MSGEHGQWRRSLEAYAESGDPAGVLDLLFAVARTRSAERRTIATGVLRGLSGEQRSALVQLAVAHRGGEAGLGSVLELLLSVEPEELTAAALRDVLEEQARRWFGDVRLISTLLELAVSAGQPVGAHVIAVARRTLHAYSWGNAELKKVLVTLPQPPLNPGEQWADTAAASGERWLPLLEHAATATSAKPSAAWEKRARALLDDVGPDEAREWLLGFVAQVGAPRTLPLRGYQAGGDETFDPHNTTALRGLLWTLAFTPPRPETARALARLVQVALKKVPGVGPRNPKTANAAVHALSRIDHEEALAQIARLATAVTFKGTLKEINAALDARAAALGLSREEVEELAVPAYGLTEVGRRAETLGDAEVELVVTGSHAVLNWRNAAGKAVKAPPASVKRDHPEALKELRAAVKDVGTMLTAQAERIDRQFLLARTWRAADWRARYLDHPLVGTLARRLIWLVDGTPVAFADGELRTVDDSVPTPGDEAVVELWHPVGRPVEEVLAWRGWLESHGVTQPFKQAHREVYLLTAAEENTRVYSNRFAAHVLRQHQFHALAATRGWKNRLRLMVDDSYPPAVRELTRWGLRAEFWIEGIGEEYGEDTTESGSYLRVVTDQVRFYPLTAPENSAHATGGGYEQWVRQDQAPTAPVPLEQVPPLVLSEVMRDVDLFVGVGSVGNDPTWQDGGPRGRFREYWASYSFGELNATAQTRREILQRLLPRLAVGRHASLEGRFLRVRGQLRTYKIHLGSGNILMEPNDQYLCIVPKAGDTALGSDVFLPFEGDRVLAVILSKALLLAKDTAITDETITRQILS
ncbi:DUF4132 domain-containing protein [Umezawaea beigongshangensis]|uniref:DUF4132 domain-containing protein n=1 Tax=Umezawaea beigongshangensis TaxID=2780383 RepID=UPI0018F26E48|nr:DUF4132 domain-containing protein [Umezawaea beigongshangensis]